MSDEQTADALNAERPGMKPRSYEVTEGAARAPARAMLRAVGMTDDDWDKPQVGVASSWNEVTPCNLPLDRLAKRAKEGVREAGGSPSSSSPSPSPTASRWGTRECGPRWSAARSSPTRSRR
jgi:dihydroxyacid dehydratase/phosphogluconate dehydratase